MNEEANRLELDQLRQELEWYKKQEELWRLTKDSSGPSTASEEELSQLRVQIRFLRSEMEHAEQEHREAMRSVQESWMKERAAWKEEMAQVERAGRARLADVEQQLQKQRERSLALLQEKDDELNGLRERSSLNSPVGRSVVAVSGEEEEWPESLAQLGSMTLGAAASGGQILHYVEELARKEVEIQGLRRSKRSLEASMREMQMSATAAEEKTAEQKRILHEEIARLERNQSREGANLEYLKNVLLEFFQRSQDPASQSHMFNAIAACLHFSPREIQRVRQQNPRWKPSPPQQSSSSPSSQHL